PGAGDRGLLGRLRQYSWRGEPDRDGGTGGAGARCDDPGGALGGACQLRRLWSVQLADKIAATAAVFASWASCASATSWWPVAPVFWDRPSSATGSAPTPRS